VQGVDTRVAHTIPACSAPARRFACEPSSERGLHLVGRSFRCSRPCRVASGGQRHANGVRYAVGRPGRIPRRAGHAAGTPECCLPVSITTTAEACGNGARETRLDAHMANCRQRTNGVDRQHSERQHGEIDESMDGRSTSTGRRSRRVGSIVETASGTGGRQAPGLAGAKGAGCQNKNKELGDLLRIEMGALLQITVSRRPLRSGRL